MGTVAELVQRVGEDLSLVPIGQAVEAQDLTRITATYNEVYARLKHKGLAVWALSGDIPTQLFPYVALMVEEKLVTSYSVPDLRAQRIKNDAGPDGNFAELKISQLGVTDYESVTEEADY